MLKHKLECFTHATCSNFNMLLAPSYCDILKYILFIILDKVRIYV